MPWGRLDDSLYDHPKLDRLPVDERLAAIGLWARSISWCNRFLTDGHVPRSRISKLDGTLELADQLVTAGLYDAVPDGYLVHDFLAFNDSRLVILERRAKEAKRKADYRATKGQKPRPAGTTTGTPRSTEANVPPSVPAGHVDNGVEMSQRDSRTRESRPDPTRPDPTRPTESLERGSAGGREDIDALLGRGWTRVTKKQRAILDEVLARHDETGAAFAAEVIRATPEGADPLASVMDADRRWQETQRRRIDAEEQAWAKAKAEDRNGAEAALGRIGDEIEAWTP